MPSKTHVQQMEMIFVNDPANLNIGELPEQEKDLIWKLRYELRDKYPQCILHLLASVKWTNYIDVAKVIYFTLISTCINGYWMKKTIILKQICVSIVVDSPILPS